jgi:mono/diheme cytochrome c family protein|tara:strand:+ start:368 stop:784 length:417 start_codon:yes stop_codon:yes gene_type:complete
LSILSKNLNPLDSCGLFDRHWTWAIILIFCAPFTALADSQIERGFELARQYCSRCHVIGDYNRMGGIGNSPSFSWMVKSVDWRERFQTFYTRRPHPVFVRVPGYARWSNVESYYPPFEILLSEIDLITEYAGSLQTAN